MKPQEQQRLQMRMQEWAKLTPEQRRVAREKYKTIKKLPPDKREQVKAQWQQYQQSLAAVRFIQNHAAQYHADPNKVIVLGTSAGGELAALVALSKEGPAHPPIAAAVILNGVFNLSYNVYVINRYLGAHCRSAAPGS